MHADRLRVRLRPRRPGPDNLAFLAQIRACSRHASGSTGSRTTSRRTGPPDIREFAAANQIELVATPTYASYLNPVDCHFTPISQFVVANADYIDWDAFAFALARHTTYRNGEHRNRRLIAAENRHRIAA